VTPFRPHRAPRGRDAYLQHKIVLFVLGAGIVVAGMAFDAGWLITLGLVVLAIGFVLRLVGERQRRVAEDDSGDGDDDDGPPGDSDATGSRDRP
jgi:hypothetical protein